MGTASRLVERGSALYNEGDVEGFCSLYSDDAVLTTPEGRFEGRGSMLPYLQSQFSMFPDVQVAVERHCEQDDLYIGEFRVRGTNTGPVPLPEGGEMAATGRAVELYGVEVVRVQGDEIVEHDMLWDRLGLLEQLGLT